MKAKKILSIMLTLILCFVMCLSMNVTASAVAPDIEYSIENTSEGQSTSYTVFDYKLTLPSGIALNKLKIVTTLNNVSDEFASDCYYANIDGNQYVPLTDNIKIDTTQTNNGNVFTVSINSDYVTTKYETVSIQNNYHDKAWDNFSINTITAVYYDGKQIYQGPMNITNADTNKTKDALIKAKTTIPSPTYTVTIPSGVSFGELTQAPADYRTAKTDQYGKDINATTSFDVTAENVTNLFDGKRISVSVTFNGKLVGTNEKNTVAFSGVGFSSGDVIGTFKDKYDLANGEENKITKSLTLNRADILAQDDYTAQLIFTVAITDTKQ